MLIKRYKCSICNNNLLNIYKLDNAPILLLSCIDNNIEYKYNTLSFSQCIKCNTIQLDKLVTLKLLYEKSHNFKSIGKIWDNYYYYFLQIIENIIINKTILEIGCPSGKLALKSFNYNKWYIVEPNKNKLINFNDNIIFIETFFDNNFKINEKIDLIIHSHVFEHIYEPNDFLKKCYEILNDDGEMIFGVPNMQYLGEKSLNLFMGICFEHTIFLNKENITYLLNKNGFIILDIIDFENHSTIYHVKKNNIIIKNFKIINYYDDFFNQINDFKLFINNCNSIISNSNAEIYIFGVCCNSQFLLSLGLNIKYIKGILDNCEEKQNNYFYGTNLLIYDPKILANKNSIVILKTGYYINEISSQIKTINENTIILQ